MSESKWSYFRRHRKYERRLRRKWDDRIAQLRWNYLGKIADFSESLW